jgi:hypothetical protein
MQRCQGDPALAIVDQSPLRRAVIAQPEVLNAPLLLPGANKRRHRALSRFGQTFGLDQKQLTFSEFEEGLATL